MDPTVVTDRSKLEADPGGPPTAFLGSEVGDLHVTARYLLEKLPLGIVLFDHQLRLTFSNESVPLSIPPEQTVGQALQKVTVESQYEDWSASLNQSLASGQEARFSSITLRQSGEPDRLVNLTVIPLTGRTDGHVVGGMLVVEDVTQQVTIEKRLMVSERLAAVGKLAARVAHELNNPLDGILRYINLAIRVTEQGRTEPVVRYLTESRKGLQRMTQIITELLEFSRTTHSVYEQTTLNQLIEDALKVMEGEAGKSKVTMVLSLDASVPPLRAGNLFQVFCNLAKNAIDAMPRGGTLTVTTELAEGWITVRFEDTGVGLPKEQDRIFEPFFTTKGPGKGTGLGLPVSRDIVERYNGQLTGENRPSGGAMFTVRVPLSTCAIPGGLSV